MTLDEALKMERYTWGPIVAVHEIGPYAILEHKAQIFDGPIGTGKYSEETSFHIFVDGRDTNHSASSLEYALVQAIAYKHDEYGTNSKAAHYFMKMIGR